MTSISNVRSEGKGRGNPGPSSSRFVNAAVVSAVVLVLASAASFVVGIEARRTLSAEALAAVSAIASAIGLLAVSGDARRIKLTRAADPVLSMLLGAAGLFAAPYLVLSHRYSDVPAGSEILFLTTAGWASILVIFTLRRRIAEIVPMGAVLLGLAGVVGIVANWERPSSFSPFVRFAAEETWMLVAGVAWAAFWWHLGRARERGALDAAAVPAAVGGALAAVLMLLARWTAADLPSALSHGGVWLYAIAAGVAAASALVVTRSAGPRAVAAATFLPAVAITALTLIEQATGAFGPQPILLKPASAGAVMAFAAAAIIWPRTPLAERPSRSRLCRAATIASAVAVAVAAVGLALPALEGHATGLRTSGADFEATFLLNGIEVVGPWVALALALIMLGVGLSRESRIVHIASVVAAGVAWPFVWATPLRTFTTFIPSEVQVDFGSEFAAIAFRRLPVPVTLAALGGVAVAVALMLMCRPASGVQVHAGQLPRGDRP